MNWSDADEIGFQLSERFPEIDPLSIRFTELYRMITELDGFDDDPAASTEATLEAIQMAWLGYFQDQQK